MIDINARVAFVAALLPPPGCVSQEQFEDEIWLRHRIYGRGLDTLSESEKEEIRQRFAKYKTAGLFPQQGMRCDHDTRLTLAENLTIGCRSETP